MLTIEPNSTTTVLGSQPSVRNTPYEFEETSLEAIFKQSYSGQIITASKTTSVNNVVFLPSSLDFQEPTKNDASD